MTKPEKHTEHDRPAPPASALVSAFDLRVLAGKDQGRRVSSREGALTVGAAEGNHLVLTDPAVSRYHVEFEARADCIAVRDLASTNGTWYRRAQVKEVLVQDTSEFDLGRSTRVQLMVSLRREPQPLSTRDRFHDLVGQSPPMRAVFSLLERAAPTDARVLILGESGTGKELAARAIHRASKRASGPFEAVNCATFFAGTEVSELFGHRKGSFTGAHENHKGIFELAHSGTLFLDEVGELSLETQKRLLRVLEEGAVRRFGEEQDRKVDVRVVAATNRDLRQAVNTGRFREDLFYRLAMIQVRMPPLRDRLSDLPLLIPPLLEQIRREVRTDGEAQLSDATLASMADHAWPGNVRELKNHLSSLVVLADQAPPLGADSSVEGASGVFEDGLLRMPLKEARDLLLSRFERRYVTALLARHDTMKEAAEEAAVDRVTLHRIVSRLGIREEEA